MSMNQTQAKGLLVDIIQLVLIHSLPADTDLNQKVIAAMRKSAEEILDQSMAAKVIAEELPV